MTKRKLNIMVKEALKIQAEHDNIYLGFQIYANGLYVLDTEEDNVIDIVWVEQDAIDAIAGIDEESILESGKKSGCYYKPILIDADTGVRITRETLSLYKRN